MKLVASFVALLLIAFPLSGCMQARSAATGCLSTEGQDVIKKIIGDETEKSLDQSAEGTEFAEAASIILRAYGGRHVINELVNEGHQHVLYDDLAAVFGNHRAGQIMGEVIGMANRSGFVAHLGAFGLGAFLGYKATARR